ncbi:MAG: tetratricopeptide repeat protein [Patescibacteria group bacterium]|jgi:tetratricopeptide (TPR) repeat protein
MDIRFDTVNRTIDRMVEAPRVALWLGRIVDACLYIAVALIPLFFLPFTLDVLELGKQTLLAIVCGVGVIAWLGQAMASRTVAITRSWMHLVVAAFTVGYALTAIFSQDRYMSFVGNFGQMQWAMASIVSFAVFYFLVVNTVKGTTQLYHLLLAFLASSTLAGFLGFLHMTGTFPLGLFGDFAKSNAFNTVGTINSLGVFMTLPLVLAASLTVLVCKDKACVLGQEGKKSTAAKALVWVALVISTLVAVAVDYWVVWAAILFGTLLVVGIPMVRARRVDRSMKLIVPGALAVIAICLLLFRTPLNLNLPSEVSPSSGASWMIARQTLQEMPLFGSGPGTWIFDYAKYRQVAVNMSQFWTIRFERGISTFLTLPAMIGLVGMALWLILLISAVAKSASHLVLEKNDDEWQAYLTVFAVWATSVFIALFYNYNFTHHFVFWFMLALLGSLVARGSFTWDVRKSALSSSVLSIVFLLACVAMISGMWLAGQRLVADAKYASAVASFRTGSPIQQSIDMLEEASTLNRWNDGYYRNLSQAYLIRASQEIQGPADAERSKKVNASVSAAVERAKKATEVSPANVDNFANFAIVLQAIASFTRGADERAIDMYMEAMKREPNNPAFMTEVGKLNVLRSDAYRQLLQSQDENVRKDAETNVRAELDKAADALNQAIVAKPDYAPAHYILGLVYERQGRVQDAITKLEQVLSVDNKNVGVAFQLGILYYRNNEKDKSQNVFEQLVAFDPNYANARWYLSAIYEERGRYDDAIAQVEKVKESNADNAVVEERLTYLKGLRDTNARPGTKPLPEPVTETVNSPSEQNPVRTQ